MPETTTTTTASTNTITENGCSTCVINFESKEAKRVHMRDEWHVYNLKRRIASLPPISFTVFDTQVRTLEEEDEDSEEPHTNGKARHVRLKSPNNIQKAADVNPHPSPCTLSLRSHSEDSEELFFPQRCLFCNFDSSSLDTNITHMSHAHSFFIPDTEHLIDISSFLSYLHTVISVFHECLFCGCERGSQAGIQDHMRGKGHCKVDFEAENELWEFWEFDGDEDGDDGSKEDKEKRKEIRLGIDEDELRLPSGKILGHRSLHARYARQHRARGRRSSSPQQQQLLTEGESGTLPMETNESKDQRVAIRKGTETSMIGVPEPQQRALMAVEKKMDALQARSSNEYQAGVERGGNRQKTFKVTSIGKKRGGLEKRNG